MTSIHAQGISTTRFEMINVNQYYEMKHLAGEGYSAALQSPLPTTHIITISSLCPYSSWEKIPLN